MESVNLDFLKEREMQLSKLLEQISEETTKAMMQIEEQYLALATSKNELISREQNVVRMEKTIRKHMQKSSDMEKKLTEASNKENTAFLQMQLLQSEMSELQNTLEKTEIRLEETLRENEMLARKNAEYMVINQKLSDEKAKLLKLQIEQGGM